MRTKGRLNMNKSKNVGSGYCKGEIGVVLVVSVGVINLSDITHYVDELMDKLYEVTKADIVRIVEVRVTRMEDSKY